MPPAKKKDLTADIITAALPLIAEKGLAVTNKDIAARAGMELSAMQDLFEEPVDILHEAFRRGQSEMERLFRQPILGGLEEHMGVLFDGMLLNIKPFGPETYLGVVFQATKDHVLREIVKRQSGKLNFAIKAFMVDMVSRSIVEEIEQVEKVNQELGATFVEHLAAVLEGKKIPAIKKAWVKQATALFKASSRTDPSVLRP